MFLKWEEIIEIYIKCGNYLNGDDYNDGHCNDDCIMGEIVMIVVTY